MNGHQLRIQIPENTDLEVFDEFRRLVITLARGWGYRDVSNVNDPRVVMAVMPDEITGPNGEYGNSESHL
jgi:hypothetical protein